METNMANFFKLKGSNLEITYRTGGNPGFIAFSFKDNQAKIQEGFKPGQIETAHTGLGLMVTVAISTTIDTGGTSFSVFLPEISVPLGQSVPFTSMGIYKEINGPIIFPKDVKVSWRAVDLEGIAETVFIP
jgi:hypothetical protein